jgi:uncharacterized membrane protein
MNKFIALNQLTAQDEASFEEALAERDAIGDHSPAYIQILTALGGWISAALMLGAWSIFFQSAPQFFSIGLPGVLGLIAGLYMRHLYAGAFARQSAAGLIVVGQLGVAFGVGEAGGFALASVAIALITLFIERRGFVGPVTVAVALAGLAGFLFRGQNGIYLNDIFFTAICIFIAFAALLIQNRSVRTEYIGLAALVSLIVYAEFVGLRTVQLAAFFADSNSMLPILMIWGGKTVTWLSTLFLLGWARGMLDKREFIAMAIISTIVFATLSFTGIAAFLLLFSGVIIGWRPAAICGLIAVFWSLSRFYYDLSLTLLEKSQLLIAAGSLLLIIAYLAHKSINKEASS